MRPWPEGAGGATNMRSEQQSGGLPERVLCREWLRIYDIKCGSNMILLKRTKQCVGVDDRAAPDVHEKRSLLHGREEVSVDQAAGVVGQRGDDDHDVSPWHQPGQ